MMFRSDLTSDGGIGGGVGGASTRKSHPIFKVRSTTTGEQGPSDSNGTSGIWSVFVCNINLNDSDPRFRPPICAALVGFATTGLGIAALLFRQYSAAFIVGVVTTALGVGILLFSLIWLFVTRQKILRALAMKAAGINEDGIDHKGDTKTSRPFPLDPIMTRGLVTIYYKSCEDTLPYGYEQSVAGRKNVRIPPTDTFIPVESSCFQLVSSKAETKAFDKSQWNHKNSGDINGKEKRNPNTSKGRTLPTRPGDVKRIQVNSNTWDYGGRTQKAQNGESDTVSRAGPRSQSAMSDLLSPVVAFDHGRSGMEYQPMLSPHSNVHKTDLHPPRRLR